MYEKYDLPFATETAKLPCSKSFMFSASLELMADLVAPVSMMAFACTPFTLIFSAMIFVLDVTEKVLQESKAVCS